MPAETSSQPTPIRKPRGGRRPGAGAPRGNTNALFTGAYAVRANTALRLIFAIPVLRNYYHDLKATPGPRAIQQRRNLIEAVRRYLATPAYPEPVPGTRLARQLEALMVAGLTYRRYESRRFLYILEDLAHPRSKQRPLDRALKHTNWLCRHDFPLHKLLMEHVLDDILDILEEIASKTIKQSNYNETFRHPDPPRTPASAPPKPPDPPRSGPKQRSPGNPPEAS